MPRTHILLIRFDNFKNLTTKLIIIILLYFRSNKHGVLCLYAKLKPILNRKKKSFKLLSEMERLVCKYLICANVQNIKCPDINLPKWSTAYSIIKI